MADFKKAWEKTSKNEGGYVNNSLDSGGETYLGISIVNNPKWIGWNIVHKTISELKIKNTLDCSKAIRDKIDKRLSIVSNLDGLVQTFYKENYWDTLDLDKEPSQLVADEVFDTAVNMGVETTRRMFNRAKGNDNV